jgi:hypothetical protein
VFRVQEYYALEDTTTCIYLETVIRSARELTGKCGLKMKKKKF